MTKDTKQLIPTPISLDQYFTCKTLQEIYTTSFVMDDLRLYLDTHPHDQNAIDAFEKYQKMRDAAIQKHETESGPINSYRIEKGTGNESNTWQWVNCPWPWEKEV